MIDSFLYVKDKNHDDLYYCVWERRYNKHSKCSTWAVTIFSNGSHAIYFLMLPVQVSHTSFKFKTKLRKLWGKNERSLQIMNNVLSFVDPEIQACLFKKKTMRKFIKWVQCTKNTAGFKYTWWIFFMQWTFFEKYSSR